MIGGAQEAGVRSDVARAIEAGNPWYVGSHFEWAARPEMRRIYEKREAFIRGCIRRASRGEDRPVAMLDAGCGDGYWLARLGDIPGVRLTGVDFNPVRVERAKEAAPSATVVCGDLQSLSADNPFDVVLLNQVIEHVRDDVGLLRVVKGLIRPGGKLILGAPNEGSWFHRIRHLYARGGPTDHVHFYVESELRHKLEQAGFEVRNVLREAFYPGFNRIYYGLLKRAWGFGLLEWMTSVWPSGCSDYYFECESVQFVRRTSAPSGETAA